jgi:nucleoside-diphosphate-sugar epimerase
MRSPVLKIDHTGASGVLGTAVHTAFEKALRYEVIGLKNKSPATHLVQLDLTDKEATKQKLQEIKPSCACDPRVVSGNLKSRLTLTRKG